MPRCASRAARSGPTPVSASTGLESDRGIVRAYYRAESCVQHEPPAQGRRRTAAPAAFGRCVVAVSGGDSAGQRDLLLVAGATPAGVAAASAISSGRGFGDGFRGVRGGVRAAADGAEAVAVGSAGALNCYTL